MPLSLSLVTSDDLPGISHVHYNAFTDPFSVALHPRTSYSNHVEAYSNHLQRAMRKLSQHLYKVVDTSNGKIISFAKWSVACLNEEMAKQQTEKVEGRSENHNGNEEASKENVETQRNESEVITRPRSKVVNMEFGHAFKKKITDIQRKHVGDRKTLFLEVLCTLPEYQGQGAAKMHLRWGEEYARKEGIPIWLDASPIGLGLYKKEGFVWVEDVLTDLAEWGGEGVCTHTCMLKEHGERYEDENES